MREKMAKGGNFTYLTFAVLYVLSANVFQADYIKSTGVYWKLNTFGDKVISVTPSVEEQSRNANITESRNMPSFREDSILQALLSTNMKDGIWTKRETLSYCTMAVLPCNGDMMIGSSENKSKSVRAEPDPEPAAQTEPALDCGKSVNFTHYDHLVGVSHRQHHPHAPEPHAELVFRRRAADAAADAVDLDQLERKLRRSKREKPKSLQLYNQIGNFWRIKGDTSKAIECFRRSLAVSPNNAEVLLNLARVLFNLQYLDDAIFLTRRSLEVQPPDQSAWLQHFTLGEILKEYGNYQEAEMHLRHTLELRPRFQPAEAALLQLETAPATRLHGYTVFIICILVFSVLFFILSTLESTASDDGSGDPARPARCGVRTARGRWRRSV